MRAERDSHTTTQIADCHSVGQVLQDLLLSLAVRQPHAELCVGQACEHPRPGPLRLRGLSSLGRLSHNFFMRPFKYPVMDSPYRNKQTIVRMTLTSTARGLVQRGVAVDELPRERAEGRHCRGNSREATHAPSCSSVCHVERAPHNHLCNMVQLLRGHACAKL
jgi:hypothetical protein